MTDAQCDMAVRDEQLAIDSAGGFGGAGARSQGDVIAWCRPRSPAVGPGSRVAGCAGRCGWRHA